MALLAAKGIEAESTLVNTAPAYGPQVPITRAPRPRSCAWLRPDLRSAEAGR